MKEYTEKDLSILEVIKNHVGAIGPTEIGIALGKDYNNASSYCSNSIKKLLKDGKIVRFKGKYKIA